MKIMNTLRALKSCDAGATLVEYGIAIVLAVLVGVGGLTLLAGEINTQMGDAQAVMQ